jgi:hypothetical protein
MSETKVLVGGAASMIVVAIACAIVLYALNVHPVWVVFAPALAGVAVYAAIMMIGYKRVGDFAETEVNENG